jgi:hypothetical protein
MIKTVVDILPTSAHYSNWVANPQPFQVEVIEETEQERYKRDGFDGYCNLSYKYLDGRQYPLGFINGALLEDNYTHEPDWEV